MSIYVQALMPLDFDRLSEKAAAIETTICTLKKRLGNISTLNKDLNLEIEDYEGLNGPIRRTKYRIDTPFAYFWKS